MILTGIEWGSVADWFAAVGTLGAVFLALWQSFFGLKREQRIKDRKIYAKNLIKSILYLQVYINNRYDIFIVENHPVARQEWEINGSSVDSVIKTSSELKVDIYNLISEMESNIKLASIDNFITNLQERYFLTNLKNVRDCLVYLFKFIDDTESNLMMIDSTRKPGESHDDLSPGEAKYFDDTKKEFDKTRKEIKKLDEMIKKIFY